MTPIGMVGEEAACYELLQNHPHLGFPNHELADFAHVAPATAVEFRDGYQWVASLMDYENNE